MNTHDAVNLVLHHKIVEEAKEQYEQAKREMHEVRENVEPGRDEFVLVTLPGGESYMIYVDIGDFNDHKVIRLSSTTPGGDLDEH